MVRFLGSFAKVLQTVPPAATALAAGMLLFDETAVPLTLSTAIFLEATHYITCAVGSRAFSSDEFRAQTLPEREDEEQLALWQQCLDETSSSSSVSTADFIRGWFIPSERASRPADGEELTVTLAELQRENVADWLAYALYAIAPSALDDEQADHVDAAIQMLEKRLTDERAPTRHNDFRFTFPAGHNSEVVAMRLNVDTPQTNMMQRPLFYYAISDALLGGLVTPHFMRARGFKQHRAQAQGHEYKRGQGGLSYWFHPGDEAALGDADLPAELLEREIGQGRAEGAGGSSTGGGARQTKRAAAPLIFVHGVGLGPLPYTKFIEEMLSNSDGAPMLVVELPDRKSVV